MRKFATRTVVGAMCATLILTSAQAQNITRTVPPGAFAYAGPPRGGHFYVAPGVTVGQLAYNTALMGRAYSNVPPYALGYNPYPSVASYGQLYNPSALYTPYTNPYVNPYVTGGGMGNPYSALYSGGLPGYGGTGAAAAALTGYAGLPSSAGGADMSGAGGSGYSPYTSAVDPYSGFLRGAADVISSQGKLEKDLQQAKIIGEHARQAHIDTRRRLFDEILYERAHTPSFNEQQEKIVAHQLRRSQLTAPITEIWSGKSLNDLLGDAVKLHGKETFGPTIALDQDTLKQINVIGAKTPGNIGLLRNEGRLSWPVGLKDLKPVKGVEETPEELREFLNSKARRAVEQAGNGAVAAGVLKDLRSAVTKLHRLLAKNVNELPTSDYIEAKRFLNNFDEAITILSRPDVGNYFNQTYVAKGKTVKDLIDYMRTKGLSFAPAVSGDEAAYQALYQALAAYDVAAHDGIRTAKNKENE